VLSRLPYRVQIPLGLSLAVVLAALLVTAVAAQIFARTARTDTLATVDRAAQLLSAQSLPLLAADDIWRVFALLRNTAAFLPGAATGQARAAVLDSDGRVFASSAPQLLRTASALMGQPVNSFTLPSPASVTKRVRIDRPDGSIALVEPIRSEDGQVLGFTYIEVDAPVFAADWAALAEALGVEFEARRALRRQLEGRDRPAGQGQRGNEEVAEHGGNSRNHPAMRIGIARHSIDSPGPAKPQGAPSMGWRAKSSQGRSRRPMVQPFWRNDVMLKTLSWLALSGAMAGSAAHAADGSALYRAQCAGCHGAAALGNAALQAPPLAGTDELYLVRQLSGFRAGHRGGEGAPPPAQTMRAVAQGLKGDEDIAAVARVLAQLRPPKAQAEPVTAAQLGLGRSLYGVCVACHGTAAEGNRELNAPRLAHLPSWYLAAQLASYRAGTRGAAADDRPGQQMRQVANEALAGQDDVDAVVRYVTTLGRRGR